MSKVEHKKSFSMVEKIQKFDAVRFLQKDDYLCLT